jgi:hypothetical protein
MFNEIIKSRGGVIMISILWGLALSTLFQKVCKGRGCIIFNAPDYDQIRENTFKHNSKCYKFKPETVECSGVNNLVEHL